MGVFTTRSRARPLSQYRHKQDVCLGSGHRSHALSKNDITRNCSRRKPIKIGLQLGSDYGVLLYEGGGDVEIKLPPLGRRQLYEIANALFQTGDHVNAAAAYNEFLTVHGKDVEAGRVLLMLGLINARFLNDPTAAKRALDGAKKKQLTEDETVLVDELLAEIG